MHLMQTGCWTSVVATLSLDGLYSIISKWSLYFCTKSQLHPFPNDWGDGALPFMEKAQASKTKKGNNNKKEWTIYELKYYNDHLCNVEMI